MTTTTYMTREESFAIVEELAEFQREHLPYFVYQTVGDLLGTLLTILTNGGVGAALPHDEDAVRYGQESIRARIRDTREHAATCPGCKR